MRVATCAAVLAASMLAVPVQAQSFGPAKVQCVQYLRAARSSDILYHQASNWLLGYVSGINGAVATMSGQATPIAMTNDQVLKSAADYCERHPNQTLANAASQWYATLPRQAAPKQAERESDTWHLKLVAPERKPILDRR